MLCEVKYCDNQCDLDMFKHKQGASNVWRGMVDNIDVLRRGVSLAVGNGQRTFFGTTNGLGITPSLMLLPRNRLWRYMTRLCKKFGIHVKDGDGKSLWIFFLLKPFSK